MPPKFQLLAVMAFGVAMLFIENQIQKLDESRAKLGKLGNCRTRKKEAQRSSSFHPKSCTIGFLGTLPHPPRSFSNGEKKKPCQMNFCLYLKML